MVVLGRVPSKRARQTGDVQQRRVGSERKSEVSKRPLSRNMMWGCEVERMLRRCGVKAGSGRKLLGRLG